MEAYSYLRVSGRGQIDGDGFDRQLLACESYATANGYTIGRVFREEGISGKSELSNRPALSELLTTMEETGVKIIIIERLDRLARDLMVSETILADLAKSGYTLLSTCEPDLCSDDPSRKLVRQIFSAIAEYDRAMIVLKLRGARQRVKAKTGRCEGIRGYGELPGESEVLALIRSLPGPSRLIADTLNARGYGTRYGKPWRASTVARILARDTTAR